MIACSTFVRFISRMLVTCPVAVTGLLKNELVVGEKGGGKGDDDFLLF